MARCLLVAACSSRPCQLSFDPVRTIRHACRTRFPCSFPVIGRSFPVPAIPLPCSLGAPFAFKNMIRLQKHSRRAQKTKIIPVLSLLLRAEQGTGGRSGAPFHRAVAHLAKRLVLCTI